MDSRLSQGYLCEMEHNKPGITLCANNFYSTSQQIPLSADEMYMVQMRIVDILLLIYISFHCLHDSHLSFFNLSIPFFSHFVYFYRIRLPTYYFSLSFFLLFKLFSQLTLLQKTLCITLFISLFLFFFLLRYTQNFCSPLTVPLFHVTLLSVSFLSCSNIVHLIYRFLHLTLFAFTSSRLYFLYATIPLSGFPCFL